jgi:hypothetical protein
MLIVVPATVRVVGAGRAVVVAGRVAGAAGTVAGLAAGLGAGVAAGFVEPGVGATA